MKVRVKAIPRKEEYWPADMLSHLYVHYVFDHDLGNMRFHVKHVYVGEDA